MDPTKQQTLEVEVLYWYMASSKDQAALLPITSDAKTPST